MNSTGLYKATIYNSDKMICVVAVNKNRNDVETAAYNTLSSAIIKCTHAVITCPDGKEYKIGEVE